jgi:hypothetical protein
MNHALDSSMFWVGALFAFTPIVLGGIVIGVWWWTRKRGAGGREWSPPEPGEVPRAGGSSRPAVKG